MALAQDCPLEQPDLRPITERHYRLYQDYCYCWYTRELRNRIRIAAGFTSDGASVPRIAWTFAGLTPDGLIRAAALVHDFLYAYSGQLPPGAHQIEQQPSLWMPVTGRWSRRDADRLFASIMRESGVSRTRRRIAYLAVRAFGGSGW
jgi:hypothetical protein